MYTLNTGFYAN